MKRWLLVALLAFALSASIFEWLTHLDPQSLPQADLDEGAG